jgi:hypothetical protein
VHLALGSKVRSSPDSEGLLRRQPPPRRAVDQVTNGDHEALACGVLASSTGVVGAAEPVVRGVKEPLKHHWVRNAGAVPLRIPV